MKKIFILLIIPFCLFAKITIRYVDADGIGSTKSSAIRNALIEMIKESNGVAISSKRSYTKAISETGVSQDGQGSHAVVIREKTRKKIREATRGFIQNYSIVNAYRKDNGWYVKLRIKIKKYKTPGFNPNKRRRMAIMPFSFKNMYPILGTSASGKQISDRFTQSLVSKMTQARKFTILDRENSRYYQEEKNFILSGNSSKDELLKLGKRLGTDYMVVGKILDFSINKITDTNNIGLPSTSKIVCSATISYRIIMMATQQIKWSETISKEFTLEDGISNSLEAIVAKAADKIAGTIMANVLNNIFPPRIIAVTTNSIIINQGGNSIQTGDIYKAYGLGQRLTDPYTHEFLGYEEIPSAKVKITKVGPKVSYANVIYGRVAKGMILRKIKSNKNATFHSDGEATTDVKIKSNGGVVLPFDQ